MSEEFKAIVDSSYDNGQPLWLIVTDYIYGMIPVGGDRWKSYKWMERKQTMNFCSGGSRAQRICVSRMASICVMDHRQNTIDFANRWRMQFPARTESEQFHVDPKVCARVAAEPAQELLHLIAGEFVGFHSVEAEGRQNVNVWEQLGVCIQGIVNAVSVERHHHRLGWCFGPYMGLELAELRLFAGLGVAGQEGLAVGRLTLAF